MNDHPSSTDLSLISEPEWSQAHRLLIVIQQLASKPKRTVAEVDQAAAEPKCSRAHLYRLLNRYAIDPRLSNLIPRRRGPARGGLRLSSTLECLIDDTIESVFLPKQRARVVDLVSEIRSRCHAAGLTPPSGHIERLIGTMMGKVHLLPGTTFSRVREKGDVDPAKTAATTLDELERWLALAITGIDHATVHRALGITPIAALQRASRDPAAPAQLRGAVALPDPRRLLIDFLPIEHRLVRRDGVSLNSIHYWSDILTSWVGEPQKRLIRYDPRDLSRIYLLGPDGHYYDLHYRDLCRPPITLFEHRMALPRSREDNRSLVDEGAIFRAIESMRSLTDEAIHGARARVDNANDDCDSSRTVG